MRTLFVTFFVLAVLLGCTKGDQTRHTVVLLDTSASIKEEAFKNAVEIISELSRRMQRGDCLTIIPISGNTEEEIQGRIIRVVMPVDRQAYDSDVNREREALKRHLERLYIEARKEPPQQTDILGALPIAEQELRLTGKSRKTVILLSDMLQDNAQFNFVTDPRLSSKETAIKLGAAVSNEWDLKFAGTSVALAFLQSQQRTAMARTRIRAITEFWREVFMRSGGKVVIYNDPERAAKVHQFENR